MGFSSSMLSRLESFRFQLLAELGERIFPLVFQNDGMAAIQFDGFGFSKGGHIIFPRAIAPLEDAVCPIAVSFRLCFTAAG